MADPASTKRGKGRLRRGTAAVAMLLALTGGMEGLRQTAYPDPATKGPPWTVCYGHTGADVRPGDRRTVAECKALLRSDLAKYAAGVEACIRVPLPDARWVAFVDFAYNLGVGAACKSTAVKLLNAGRTREACDYLLKYNRAAGIVFPGLTRRRERERQFCMEGL